MVKPTVVTFLALLFLLILFMVTRDWETVIKTFGVIGGALWLLAAILSGALVSGDRNRANFGSETVENFKRRHSISGILFMYGLLFFGIGLALFIILKYFFEMEIHLMS